MATIKLIATDAKPIGPYSHAIIYNNTCFISGTLGTENDKLVDGGAAAEARQSLVNIGAVLKEAGSSYDTVVKTTVMLTDITDFQAVNEVYKEFFPKEFPARSTFQVSKLPLGAKVEIEAIAAIGNVGKSWKSAPPPPEPKPKEKKV